MQDFRVPTGLGDYGGSVVAADVVKGSQHVVRAADCDYRLAGNRECEEISGPPDLIGSANDLPGAAENRIALQFRNTWIDVP